MASIANLYYDSMSTRVSDADRGCPMRANYSAGAAEGSGLNHLAGLSSY